jgi:hypothetical protein
MQNPPYLTHLAIGTLLLGAALPALAAAQNPGQWSKYRAHIATETWSRFGETSCSVGDVDGDGTADYLVGALNGPNLAGDRTGAVHLFSGATGALIRTHYGTEHDDRMGIDLAATGDVNGDGIPDYAASELVSPDFHGLDLAHVNLYSGADGSIIHSWLEPQMGSNFGNHIKTLVIGLGTASMIWPLPRPQPTPMD